MSGIPASSGAPRRPKLATLEAAHARHTEWMDVVKLGFEQASPRIGPGAAPERARTEAGIPLMRVTNHPSNQSRCGRFLDFLLPCKGRRRPPTEAEVTAAILARHRVGPDYVAVRIQADEFTDFATNRTRGHEDLNIVARDWYAPERVLTQVDAGFPPRYTAPEKRIEELVRIENRDALNVFLIPEERVSQLRGCLGETYCSADRKSWVTFPLKDALAMGAKVYRDAGAVFQGAFALTFPKGTDIPVDIYPTDDREPRVRARATESTRL